MGGDTGGNDCVHVIDVRSNRVEASRLAREASPVGTVWGIGLSESAARLAGPEGWRGLNLLGYALMQVRDQLRDPLGSAAG